MDQVMAAVRTQRDRPGVALWVAVLGRLPPGGINEIAETCQPWGYPSTRSVATTTPPAT